MIYLTNYNVLLEFWVLYKVRKKYQIRIKVLILRLQSSYGYEVIACKYSRGSNPSTVMDAIAVLSFRACKTLLFEGYM